MRTAATADNILKAYHCDDKHNYVKQKIYGRNNYRDQIVNIDLGKVRHEVGHNNRGCSTDDEYYGEYLERDGEGNASITVLEEGIPFEDYETAAVALMVYSNTLRKDKDNAENSESDDRNAENEK